MSPQGCPSALGDFIPGFHTHGMGGVGWDSVKFHGRSPGERGLFSLEKAGLRHSCRRDTEQGEEPAGVLGNYLKGIQSFFGCRMRS